MQDIVQPKSVIVHPLVLLSVVDHYNRVLGRNKNRRVVGVLLGEQVNNTVDITNCYAVPFEEDLNDNSVWFLDHNYHETMFSMQKKVNAKEIVVGWYTTGTKFKSHDVEINEVIRKYCPNPVLVVIDVEHSDELALPTEAYFAKEQVDQNGQVIKNFIHIPSTVEALEPEEIGVEHLLREIKDLSLNSLSNKVQQKMQSLQGMFKKISFITEYLKNVLNGKLKANNQILYNIQEIINLLPNVNQEDLIKSFSSKNNDNMFVLYVCALTRSIIALHTLINNKITNREQEKKDEKEKTEQKEKTENKDKAAEKNKDKDTANKDKETANKDKEANTDKDKDKDKNQDQNKDKEKK